MRKAIAASVLQLYFKLVRHRSGTLQLIHREVETVLSITRKLLISDPCIGNEESARAHSKSVGMNDRKVSRSGVARLRVRTGCGHAGWQRPRHRSRRGDFIVGCLCPA